MAGNLWGADVAQLRTLAQQFGKTSDSLLQQSTQLSNQINNNPAWKGQDAVTFRSDWNSSHRALIQRTALALKQESKKLLTQAEEQEKASTGGGDGGGPGTGGAGSSGDAGDDKKPFQLGPDWLADSDDSPSPFRGGWDTYNLIKAFPNIRAGVFDAAAIMRESGFRKSFTKAAWDTFQESNAISRYFNMSSDLFDGKFHNVLNLAPDSSAFKVLGGFGHALGGLGVGLDTLDAVNKWQAGDTGGAYYSGAKAALGVVSFFPPPVGTAAMVASGALAIYDNVPAVKNFVNGVGGQIAEGWNAAGHAIEQSTEAAGEAIADAGEAVSDAVGDGAKAVSKFFGF
ncbi:hypothetical protein AB0N24_00355 [Arthrobacter sp. NPDC093128]|uniref:hypothetical protein n=1 Tax=Arthrobacter sp. NPDC093128 TaxID=3154979 RepID=UPI00343FEC2E